MNKILAVAAVVLSVASMGVALTRGGEQASAPAPAVERAARPEAGADEARMAALEVEISRLMRRVDALERPSMPKPGEPAAAMTTEQQSKQLQALRSDVDALLTGEPTGTEEGRKRLKQVVRSIQDEVFTERNQERAAQRDQERADRVKKFVEEARLSSSQAQDLTKLLDDESKQRQALFDARRAGGPGAAPGAAAGGAGAQPSARDQMRNLRQATDDGAKALLDAGQYTQYQAMRSEDRGGGGGRGPGGGGGGQRNAPGP